MNNFAKKSLGQHWLDDDASLQAMCDAVEVVDGDVVLEVGPGHGALTDKLFERGARVIAVELDDELISELTDKYKDQNFEIHHKSILDFDFASLPKGYKVVANIPYYLTSNLLRLMCESPNPFSEAALLIQKEVAERVAARPGDMSILSVSVQFYANVGLGPVVPAELFTPAPKVDSQILMLDYRGPLFTDVAPNEFFRVVKAGFSERRKMLRSSISGGLGLSKDRAEELLTAAAIDATKRAQELSLEDWRRLALVLKNNT